jgi:TetR/AcrR family transcriptional regulator
VVQVDEAEVLSRGLVAFAELGYDATSVRELAKRLGVSHNFINDRYGSKAEFWRAVVGFGHAQMREHLGEVLSAEFDDDAQRLAAVVRRMYREMTRNPHLNRMMVEEAGRDSPRLEEVHRQYALPILAAVEPYLERLMDAGRIPRVPKHLYFVAVMGPISALNQQQLARKLGRPEPSSEEDLLQLADSLADFVLHGLLPSGG